MKKNEIVIRSAVRKNKTVLRASKPRPKAFLSRRQGLARECYVPSTSKLRIKNTAYLGEIGRKVELSKRRKIKNRKIIFRGFALNSYTTSPTRSGAVLFSAKKPRLYQAGRELSPKVSNNFKKYILYFKKKTWYTDKAAPIPGGNHKLSTGFVRKEKFYKKIFRAYILFKTYLNMSKKRLKKLCVKSSRTKDLREFSTIMHMDSLFYCSMGKSSLQAALAPGLGKALNRHATGIAPKAIAPISRSPYFLNGKYITKKNFVLYRKNKVLTHRASGLKDGDFCIGY